jgi:long-chain acyl-CoA synthetase
MTISAPPSTACSVGAHFLARCASSGGTEAFRSPSADGSWTSITWRDLAIRTTELAAGLLALGVQPEQRVAIASTTRMEWVLADLAVALAGAATTTVYPTTNADDVAYILGDCAASVAVVEDAGQVAKLRTGAGWVGGIRHVIAFEPVDEPAVLTLDELAARGRAHLAAHPDGIDRSLASVGPQSLATLVYTSGTTGRPKGVELTHGNWLYLGSAVAEVGLFRPDHLHLLWLPLSHVFGKLLLAAQNEVGFATAVDGRVDRIVGNLSALRPHVMAAAPRIFEKLHARLVASASPDGIRDLLGGRLEVLISGSAALAPHVAEWFAARGLPILEGYGLTEATGASFVNRPGRGGTTRFVLSTNGHIAALINPPGNPRSSYRVSADTTPDAAGWAQKAPTEKGSWWPDFAGWLGDRSGEEKPAPAELGNERHRVLEPSPGSYVLDA